MMEYFLKGVYILAEIMILLVVVYIFARLISLAISKSIYQAKGDMTHGKERQEKQEEEIGKRKPKGKTF